MATPELTKRKEVILDRVQIIRVAHRQTELLPQLAQIYFQTWNNEGLCPTYEEAFSKMESFNPDDTYVIIDDSNHVYALIQTLPVALDSPAGLPDQFPTYQSVESASTNHLQPNQPNFIICFSINALPGFRIQDNGKNVSLARYLLTNLPVPPNCHKIAYSRFRDHNDCSPLDFYLQNQDDPQKLGAVGMHENLGGITVAIIYNSRPEDIRGGGANVIVYYPNNQAEADRVNSIKSDRLKRSPPVLIKENHALFLDAPPFRTC